MKNFNYFLKFAALSFTTLEYFMVNKESLIELQTINLKNRYGYDTLNRSKKNTIDKKIQNDIKIYKKHIASWQKTLESLSGVFENSEKETHRNSFDFSIDSLHRALDTFKIENHGTIVKDKVKKHIFDSLDKIEIKERSEADIVRINASFDNFLTLNKLKK